MGKDKSKDRDAKKSGRYYGDYKYIGIAELKGFYFGHGDHGSGNRFNKTLEKIAEYCRVEISKDIYNLILYGEEPEYPEIEAPSGNRPAAAALRKYELEYKRLLERKEDFQKDKCKTFGIVLGQCRQLTKEVVKADKAFRAIEKVDDVTGLLSIS